jgi:hypothetical protein
MPHGVPEGSELRLEDTGVSEMVQAAGFVASVRGQLRVITDTDAPRSVVRAGEKTEEVRLRSAVGSREWLRPAARCGIVSGARPWCGPRRARAGLPVEPIALRVQAVASACRPDTAVTAAPFHTRGRLLTGRPLAYTTSLPALRLTGPLLFLAPWRT